MTGTYPKPTRKQIDRALEDLANVTKRTPIEKARDRVEQAKEAWTRAAEAARRGDVGAPAMADIAFAELNRARAALTAIDQADAA